MKFSTFLKDKWIFLLSQTGIILFMALLLNVMKINNAVNALVCMCVLFITAGAIVLEYNQKNGFYRELCNGVQREHNKKLNNGLPILHKVPPKRDYGRYFCIMAEKGGTSHGGLTEKLSPFFHAKKQEVNAYGR